MSTVVQYSRDGMLYAELLGRGRVGVGGGYVGFSFFFFLWFAIYPPELKSNEKYAHIHNLPL